MVSVADYGPSGSLVRDLARSPFVVAWSKSHLPPAQYWLNPGGSPRFLSNSPFVNLQIKSIVESLRPIKSCTQ